jgi:hypothetical protein
MSLLCYLRDDCRKQAILISESRGDLNRCTPCRGKPDQHATRFPRLIRVWSWTIHLLWSTYATFPKSPQNRNRPLHPEEVLANKDRLARPSPWVTSFFHPHDNLGVWERDFGQVVTQVHQLTGPITPLCDRYVQYLLAGVNPSVLNWHSQGLQPWRCRLPTHHSLTFPTDGPPLST